MIRLFFSIVTILYFLAVIPVAIFCFSWMNFRIENLPPADIALHSVIKKTVEELKRKYQLSLIGTGGSGDDNEITMSSISFELAHSMSQEECRKVILDCAQLFLKEINSDAQLTPYLSVKPFGYKNIEVLIFMSHPDRSRPLHPSISVVSLTDGIIKYRTVNPENTYEYKSVVRETYEEALRKVQSSDNL